MNISHSEYWKEVSNLAESMLGEALQDNGNDLEVAKEEIQDYRLHETIDGHMWIIYTTYHTDIAEHSHNEDYYKYIYCSESLGEMVYNGGVEALQMTIAFFAFQADVQYKLQKLFEEKEAA